MLDVNHIYHTSLDEVKTNSPYLNEGEAEKKFKMTNGATAAHLAAMYYKKEDCLATLECLHKYGLDFSIINSAGFTAFIVAIQSDQNEEVLELLGKLMRQEQNKKVNKWEKKSTSQKIVPNSDIFSGIKLKKRKDLPDDAKEGEVEKVARKVSEKQEEMEVENISDVISSMQIS